jgi:large subunit ribosomal protein L15
VRLDELHKMQAEVIDLGELQKAGVVSALALRAKVILSGEIKRKVVLKGVLASKGARAAIEAAGGNIEEPAEAAGGSAAQKGKAE